MSDTLPRRFVLLFVMGLLAMGCSSLAYTQQDDPATDSADNSANSTAVTAENSIDTAGEEIALRALALVGKPYQYGGADLQGFDCSGLVYYIHQALGLTVPRTAADQQRAAMHVARSALQPGDLVFFKTTRSKRVSHVGVYVGENRFVHAPQTGKLIELRTLDDKYYGSRLVGTGRLYPGS